jgi:hypothetical protein
MPEGEAASNHTDEQDEARLVGARLEPNNLESEFWQSDTAASTILSVNRWGVATSVAVIILGTCLARRRPRGCWVVSKYMFLASLVFLCFQAWGAYCRPRTYVRHHRLINAATRLLRVGQSALIYLLTSAQQPSSRAFMFMVSQWPWFSFMNAVNFPLPWRWQLPVVVVKATVDILFGVPVVNCALLQPQSQHTETAGMVCRRLLGTLSSAGQLVVPIHAGYEDIMCGESTSGLAVALFLQLFVGLAIPLQISYWYEQRAKTRFLAARGHSYVNTVSAPLQKFCWCVAWALLCCITARHMISLDWFSPQHCGSRP